MLNSEKNLCKNKTGSKRDIKHALSPKVMSVDFRDTLEALRRHDTRPNNSPLFLLSSDSFSRSELLGILSSPPRLTPLLFFF